jgi:hypothetical protein
MTSADNTGRRIAQERRIAREGREAEHGKQASWVAPEELAGEGNPHELELLARSGRVRARFYHSGRHGGRWWVWKEAMPREAIRIGSDGRSLVDNEQWALRVNEADWREYRDQQRTAEPSSQPETASANEADPPASMPPAEMPTLSSAPGSQTEQPLPPPKTRTKKRTTIEEYTAFQNDYLKKYGAYASKGTEKIWAEAKGRSARHVRDELRPQYREGLPPPEQVRFQSHSKKAQPPDDGRDDGR